MTRNPQFEMKKLMQLFHGIQKGELKFGGRGEIQSMSFH